VRLSHLIILLGMNLVWAGVYSAYKVIEPNMPSGGIVTLRYGIAAACLLVTWPWLPGLAPRGRDLLTTILLGVAVFALGQRLQVYGNAIGSAGNSAVLMALEPLVASVAAAIILKEHVGPRRAVGFGLGIAGVVLLNRVWSSEFHWGGLKASLIFISSFICEAGYSVFSKPITTRAGIMKILAVSLFAGTVANFLIDGTTTLRAARSLPSEAWVLLAVLAVVCTVVGYAVWLLVIRECPVNVAALTIFAQSIFGVFIAALWVHEPLHGGHFWGSATILAGLIIGLSRQIQAKNASRSEIRAN
jgi:drug/metabolite transporter (DMT)-like permease